MSAAPHRREAHTLELTRLLAAPPALVFRAWTNPEMLVRWWGPNDFTIPSCHMDCRPGGSYRICMRGPDGTDHWAWGDYREVSPPERLVFTWRRDAEDGPDVETLVTVTLSKEGTGTRLHLHHTGFAGNATRDSHRGGWGECLDKLVLFATTLR